VPTFLVGSAYAVSSGLIVYGISEDVVAEDSHAALLVGWAVAGLLLAFIAVIAAAFGRGSSKSPGAEH
jgi:amino acid transporter